MNMTGEQLDKAIADRPYPKVTKESIESRIVLVDYIVVPDSTVTICNIRLDNGYSVRGESACVDPRNFDPEIGQNLAYKDAFAKLWALEGYLLAERMAMKNVFTEPYVARICHEVNRAYCQALGDNSQLAWMNSPEWQRRSAILGVRLHLNNPDAGPEASHESWMKEKEAEGWKYGEVKDPEAKTHPCMVPFDQLPREQQAKDFIFRAVVHAVAGVP